jgi:uncharacterized membrane protein YdjX (TVP38/TMEM64 family)
MRLRSASERIIRFAAWTITVAVVVLTIVALFAPQLTLAWLAPFGTPEEARALVARAGALGWAAYLLLWVLQAVAAPIPAFALTLAGGSLFGFWRALALTTTGAMLGALLTYWIGAHLRREKPRDPRAERIIQRWGAWGIFGLRLIPLFPFDPVSYIAGYFRVQPLRFTLATLAGMMPATVVLTLIGSGKVRDSMYWPLFAVAAGVWVLALIGGALYARRRQESAG